MRNKVLANEIDKDIITLENATEEETYKIFRKYRGNIDTVNNWMTFDPDNFNSKLKSALEGYKLYGYKNKSDSAQQTKEESSKVWRWISRVGIIVGIIGAIIAIVSFA